ncbi:MAG: D-amino acid aminotransferase [Proteobacteria bacterium]|nr:D-amino acid aminotransferase [Pseudomonadota bacterium]
MSIVYLNGEYMPMEEAKISPMDRGFLFGDGIYEVIPSYDGKLVGFAPHMERMQDGLDAIEIKLKIDQDEWRGIAQELADRNGDGNLGIYFHVSRGADTKRNHAYPENIAPTIYAFAFEIPAAPIPEMNAANPYKVSTTEDLRWKRCNIKSTALLGNVMHYQHGHSRGHNETILYNQDGEVTEAAACNVYVIKNGVVATPLLDNQILPGITRLLVLSILGKDGSIPIEERIVTLAELHDADEVWISSSSKEIAPVVEIDGKAVGNGKVGAVWLAAQTLYTAHKYDY